MTTAEKSVDTVREMSHAMRTPLTSVMGFAGLLLENDGLDPEQREFVQIISDEAHRLAELLDDYCERLCGEDEKKTYDTEAP